MTQIYQLHLAQNTSGVWGPRPQPVGLHSQFEPKKQTT